MMDTQALPPFDIEAGALIVAGMQAPPRPKDPQEVRDGPTRPLTGIGVRRADGTIARFGKDVYLHRRSVPVALETLSGEVGFLPGRHIYGGVTGPEFGHLFTQSVGRLWLCDLFPDVPVVFIGNIRSFMELPGYFVEAIRRLGIRNPVRLITKSTQVEELIVGEELCNLHSRPISVTPFFANWLASHRPDHDLDPGLRVYVSRSGLAPGFGQYLQETVLEEFLHKQGYQILRPEQVPIAEQIRIYLSASSLIFADGSAVHLWSLFGHRDQQAAVILRRPMDRHVARWFRGLPGLRADFLDFRLADFSARGGPSNTSAALLDLKALCADLHERGYVGVDNLVGPPRQDLDHWIAQIERGTQAIKSAPFALDPRSRKLLSIRRSGKASDIPALNSIPDALGVAVTALPDQTGE